MKIQLSKVGKRYRREWIFRNIDYEFQQGKKYAILGPNGAGKSTLMRILSGHLSPSKGKIALSNKQQNLSADIYYKQISYAAPYIDLIEEFTLQEMLHFHQRFKPFLNQHTINDLIELLDFKKSQHKEIRYFSSGMKQRLKLVLALCVDTRIVLLDEPTSNLDEQGIAWYRSLVERYSGTRMLIIASNVLQDYDFCDSQLEILNYKSI